jgi:hypothetical protein
MSYLAILATIAFLLWLILDRSSWLTYRRISIIIFWATVSATNFCFPFWKIYSPQTGVSIAFSLIFIGLPITILKIVALSFFLKLLLKRKIKKEHVFSLVIVALGFLCFGLGYIHNDYQSIPINNLNLYLKPREYIVRLIKVGTLHGEKSCMQNFNLYEKEFELDECIEEIELPEKYKGLSRDGKVFLTKTSEELSIRFTHSTYNFGDGSIDIVYSSLDNSLSKPKWEINPPPRSNKQAKITEQELPTKTPIVTETGSQAIVTETGSQGFTGVVQERLPDLSYGQLISDVLITFESEDGKIKKTVVSQNGSYRIALPVGRYRVIASHPNYEIYTTGSGYFVVSSNSGFSTGNIFMNSPNGIICPSSGKFNKNQDRSFLKQSDRPPTVNISIHPSVVKRAQKITVTVSGRDDRGLESIWWVGEQTGDNHLDNAHSFDCYGKQICAFNETVSTQVIGNLILMANARDLAYPTTGEAHQASEGEGMACATVTVTK